MRTEGEKLAHSLRNILAAMSYGMQALHVAQAQADQTQFDVIEAAMKNQLKQLKDSIALVVHLVEPQSAAGNGKSK